MRRIVPLFLAVALLVGVLAVPALAAELTVVDPYELAESVTVDGDNDVVHIRDYGLEDVYWVAYQDGALAKVHTGYEFAYSTQERWIDNKEVYGFPLGKNVAVAASGIPDDATIELVYRLSLQKEATTQGFGVTVYYSLERYDSAGNSLGVTNLAEGGTASVPAAATSLGMPKTVTITGADLGGCASFKVFVYLDFYGVADESVTTYITLTFLGGMYMDIPISSLYRLQQQTGETNKLLAEVEQQLEANGQKLDEIINGDSGVDTGDTDFGAAADDMQSAGQEANDAIGAGLGTLGDLASSGAVTSTLAVLGGAFAGVFEGNEITLCGMTFNPFEVIVVVLGSISLLGLFIAYIFRKRGDG